MRTHLLVPVVLVAVMLGALAYRGQFQDVVAAFAFGVIGYYMKRFGWPRLPFVIALVLGPLFEAYLHQTLRLQELGRIDFWSRPLVLMLVGLTLATLILPYRRMRWTAGSGGS